MGLIGDEKKAGQGEKPGSVGGDTGPSGATVPGGPMASRIQKNDTNSDFILHR